MDFSKIITYGYTKPFFFLFLLWAILVLGYSQQKSFGQEVRYYQIAEGNISKAIHLVWDQGWEGVKGILASDAEEHGRIRPGHWLYYNIPFALTLVRNGDLFRSVPDVPISQRINGDLQTHALFLIFSLAIACACISMLTWKLSSSIIAAMLFPVYVASSFTICDNLIVNHCDSQEIPQLFFISLYFLMISNLFVGKSIGRNKEILASVFLVIAYFTKETSILLMPVFLMALFFLWYFYVNAQKDYMRSLLTQWSIHIFCFVILLFLVRFFRSGHYSSDYYILSMNFLDTYIHHFYYSWYALRLGVPWPGFALVGLIALAFFVVYSKGKVFAQEFPTTILLFISFAMLIGFWAINIPWMQSMAKYYITAFFFASFFVICLQVFVYNFFKVRGLHLAGVTWIIGTTFFMLQSFDVHKNQIDDYYIRNYWIRQSIPLIAKDISDHAQADDGRYDVLVIDGERLRDGLLQLQRQVNLIHGVNIAVDGRPVNRVRSHERNYFRIDLNSPSVEIRMDSKIKDGIFADWIYVLDGALQEKETAFIGSLGYELSAELRAGTEGPRVLKFMRI